MMRYADRVSLARFILKDLAWGPNQTMSSFVARISGPNEKADRIRYVNSWGDGWPATSYGTDLRTWIEHEDSSRLDGPWDERIRSYYTDRGYPR